MSEIFNRLNTEVIQSGLCTHCGTCVGLNNKLLEFRETPFGPLPFQKGTTEMDPITYFACPGKGVPYPTLFESISGN